MIYFVKFLDTPFGSGFGGDKVAQCCFAGDFEGEATELGITEFLIGERLRRGGGEEVDGIS